MLACRLDVAIRFDIPLTILSAVVAVVFTFAALGSADLSDTLKRSRLIQLLKNCKSITLPWISTYSLPLHHNDVEAGYVPIADHDDQASAADMSDRRHSADEGVQGEANYDGGAEDEREDELERRSPPDHQDIDSNNHHRRLSESSIASTSHTRGRPRLFRGLSRASTSTVVPAPHSSSQPQAHPPTAPTSTHSTSFRTSTDSDGSPSTDSSGSDEVASETTLASTSWGESLHVGLSRETRMRIKAQTRDRPIPTFGWRYWLMAHYKTITALVAARAAIWGLAIVFMHYCGASYLHPYADSDADSDLVLGMWAMEIPSGRISWDMRIVVLSYVVAFLVCFIACTAMVHMEVHFGRQVAFSTIAAFGCCAMHYTGAHL